MRIISVFRSVWRNLTARRKVEQDLTDEINSYIELSTAAKIRQGLAPGEARRQVMLEIEGAEQVKERVRQTRAGHRLEIFLQDLRFACRSLRKAPVFSLTVFSVLALGIGSTTLMFAIVNSVLLEGPRYPDSDRIMTLWQRIPEEPRVSFSPREFELWKKQTQIFDSLGFVTGTSFTVTGRGDPDMIVGRTISPEIFKVLGTGPFLGRAFAPNEIHPHVVILSYGTWQAKFASRRDVIGESITMNGESYTVIGVMPEDFAFEAPEANLFVPAALDTPLFSDHPDAHFLRVFGRLKSGVTRQQLDAEVALLGARANEASDDPTQRRFFALPLTDLTTAELRTPLLVLLCSVIFLLLVACANVANLVLARANARRGEMAIRSALGASRPRLIGQLLVESAVLASVGGGLGIAAAWWALEILAISLGRTLPELMQAHFGLFSIVIAVIASGLTAIVFGLGPALSASRVGFGADLKNSSRSIGGGANTHQFLVFGELAIAAALLVCCILMIRSFSALTHVDPGFRATNIVTAEVFLPKERYPEASQMFGFHRALLESIRNNPRFESGGMVTHLPFGGNTWGNSFDVEGHVSPAGVDYSAQIRPVSDGYFETLGIPFREGQGFKLSDDGKAPRVAVINAALAKRFWPNDSPIGKRIRYYRDWLSIIGVCGNIKHARLDAESDMEIYVPYLQLADDVAHFVGRDLNYVVRASQPGLTTVELRNAVRALDPEAVVKLNTMEGLIRDSTAQPRFRTWLITVFSATAVILACLGIYGVIAYLVTQRYREIGIRMALGASRRNIFQLVLGRMALLAAAGICAGLIAALFLTRFLKSMLYGVSVHDPATFIGVPLCLVVVALMAAYLPARRAAQIDPVRSLRYD